MPFLHRHKEALLQVLTEAGVGKILSKQICETILAFQASIEAYAYANMALIEMTAR